MFEWANCYPEVQSVCKLFKLTELNNPRKFFYTHLPCLLQNGPQCGFVALAICSQYASKKIVQKLIDYAKGKSFTNNGEMLSAADLRVVAAFYLQDKEVILRKGCIDHVDIKEHLLRGGLMLVPYDTDGNFYPCLRNGHKAHWATLSGAIETDTDFFVIARHGKTRRIAIWKLQDLSKSNQQLNEFSPSRKFSNLKYIVPEGGINGLYGLASFSILIREKCNNI